VSLKILPFLHLTKPSIVFLVLVTSLAALAGEGFLFWDWKSSLYILIAIGAAAGSANAFNQYLDRDIDQLMNRTKTRRPIPQGLLSPLAALIFAWVLAIGSTLYLWIFWTPLSALISVATIFYYAVFYTQILKRRHHYNIVIGGAAGAAGPLIAWAAVTGEVSVYAWIMFLIIFMWTPPHFWALALAIKDEYKSVHVPMLPVTHGVKRTELEIWIYTLLLLPLTLAPYFLGGTGKFYLATAGVLWLWYFWATKVGLKKAQRKDLLKLFGVSIIYLFLLFIGMIVDGGMRALP